MITDVFASALDVNPDFARALCKASGLETDASDFDISTQLPLGPAGRLDLEILLLDDNSSPVGRLWSEHKLDAVLYKEQLTKYHDALQTQPGRNRLVAIVPDGRRVPPGPWATLTWQQVGDLANAVARQHSIAERGDANWHLRATGAEATARERILYEFLRYLEEERRVSVFVEPLKNSDILVLSRMDTTRKLFLELLDRTADRLRVVDRDGDAYDDGLDAGAYWVDLRYKGDCWATAIADSSLSLGAASKDEWARDRIGEPAFGVGWSFPERANGDVLRAQSPWLDKLDEHGISVAVLPQYKEVFCYRTMYLAEVVPRGSTLDIQATALAKWADESIALIAKCPPPTLPPSPAPTEARKPASKTGDGTPIVEPAASGKRRASRNE